LKTLWQHAESHTPHERLPHYTQAMMDLGATLCTRSKPRCSDCPLANDCVARAQGNPQEYPGRKPAKKTVPVRTTQMLLLRDTQGRVLLERRPPTGLWGGLWSLPQCASEQDMDAVLAKHALREHARAPLAGFRHTFSHFHLDITPVLVDVRRAAGTAKKHAVRDSDDHAWIDPAAPGTLGLAAPVVKLLSSLS